MFCNAQQRMPWEAHLCFCRCLWPQRKVKEDDPPYDPSLTREMQRGYQSVSFSDFIEDDGGFVGFFQRPVRVGASILIYGRREGRWPWHCMAGPDWPGSVLVYTLIIAAHVVVLGLCTTCLGWQVQAVGWIGGVLLLLVYTALTCTNPGLVFKPGTTTTMNELSTMESGAAGSSKNNDDSEVEVAASDESASEDSVNNQSSNSQLLKTANESSSSSNSGGGGNSARVNPLNIDGEGDSNNGNKVDINDVVTPPPPSATSASVSVAQGAPPKERMVPCGQCEIDRPMSARHCIHCGQCIINIDHHCPWSGKCIAENNMKEFNVFLCLVCAQFYLLVGIFVYYWVACYTDVDVPKGG